MSNTPTHPGTDTPEPILPDDGDADAVGRPLPGGGDQTEDVPVPGIPDGPGLDVVSPEPSRPL